MCLHATSQKRALSHAISLAVNYCLFSHADVSYRFNGKNDNVVRIEVFQTKNCDIFLIIAQNRDFAYRLELFVEAILMSPHNLSLE